MLEILLGSKFGGSSSEETVPDDHAGMIAVANASRDAMITQSNNNLLATQTEAAVMEAQFQTLAWRRRWRI